MDVAVQRGGPANPLKEYRMHLPLIPPSELTFGQHGANELFCRVALYALVSTTLNAFDVPTPERD